MNKKPSFLNLLRLSLSLGLKNIWRNKILSLTTIFVTGTILFIFNVILSINLFTQNALQDLSEKVDLIAYIKEGTQYETVQQIVQELQQVEGIKEIHYISKEDALSKISQTHPDIFTAFDRYNLGNPLPASLNIKTTHPDYQKPIADFLGQTRYSAYLSGAEDNNQNSGILNSVALNLAKITTATEQVIFWLIITFILGGTLIIINALQMTIFSRKKEIAIMKMVGASDLTIRAPFIIEGIFYALSASILSGIMLILLGKNLSIDGSSIFSLGQNADFFKIFLIQVLATILIGTLSALVTIEEYLKADLQT